MKKLLYTLASLALLPYALPVAFVLVLALALILYALTPYLFIAALLVAGWLVGRRIGRKPVDDSTGSDWPYSYADYQVLQLDDKTYIVNFRGQAVAASKTRHAAETLAAAHFAERTRS